MNTDKSSYKNTVKSTAVFGGAQLVQMIITIIRAKTIAVLLGSHGMGINAIFQSSVAIISSFSSFGIFQSAVRDISQVYEGRDEHKLSKTATIFQRLTIVTGVFGMLICLVSCAWLSKLAFENYNYTWQFALLSLGILFSALSNGKTVFLEGTRNLTNLAKASLLGALLSLIVGFPLYYYLGVKGIVLAIVSSYVILYLTQTYFTKNVKLKKIESISLRETFDEGKPIVKLGTVLMLGMVVLTGFTYLTNIFIGRFGRIEDVGLFQGVSSISTQSIAIVISVLASDFFPRLSAVYKDTIKVKLLINQQTELVSLIITPIVVILIIFAPLIVKLLLSGEFLIVVPMLRLMSISLLARGLWLIMSYTILAKGDKKTYFIFDSLIGNGLLFLLNISAYYYWGLFGLGVSFFLGSLLIAGILFFIANKKYGISLNKHLIKRLMVLIMLVISAYLTSTMLSGWLHYIISALIIGLTFSFSFYILNREMGIGDIIKSKLKSPSK